MVPPPAELVRRERMAVVGEVAVPGSNEIWAVAETVASLAPTVTEELPPFVVEKGRDLVTAWTARARQDGNSGSRQNGPEKVLGFSV